MRTFRLRLADEPELLPDMLAGGRHIRRTHRLLRFVTGRVVEALA